MQRLLTLKRLGSVYGLMEEMHSLQARVASAAVGEVETAISSEAITHQAALAAEREALHGEDLLGRSAMAVREEVAIQKTRKLEPILEQRREVREFAQIRYADSRLWSERMKALIDAELERIATEKERRTQAASDDRFLAQSRMKRGKDRRPGR